MHFIASFTYYSICPSRLSPATAVSSAEQRGRGTHTVAHDLPRGRGPWEIHAVPYPPHGMLSPHPLASPTSNTVCTLLLLSFHRSDNTILMPNNHSVTVEDLQNGKYSVLVAIMMPATVPSRAIPAPPFALCHVSQRALPCSPVPNLITILLPTDPRSSVERRGIAYRRSS